MTERPTTLDYVKKAIIGYVTACYENPLSFLVVIIVLYIIYYVITQWGILCCGGRFIEPSGCRENPNDERFPSFPVAREKHMGEHTAVISGGRISRLWARNDSHPDARVSNVFMLIKLWILSYLNVSCLV